MNKEEIVQAVKKLREGKERNFDQSVDLIINLTNIDKGNPVNLFLDLPNKVKDVKVCGFFENKKNAVDTVNGIDFNKYDQKSAKKLAREYDFFIASGKLMPQVGKVFGRALGPEGKMPSPHHGIVKEEKEEEIEKIAKKFQNMVRIKSEEPSVKFQIAKESLDDVKIAENAQKAYDRIVKELPNEKQNVKSVMIKFTMTKPERLEK